MSQYWGPRSCYILNFKLCISYYHEHFLLKFQNNFTQKYLLILKDIFAHKCMQNYITSIFTDKKDYGLSQYNVDICT